ncbi:hypothetical protein SAMN05216312_108122 [Cohnella sp. OV330]|uniref:hypothetical protein n=1 Tax=Cohnella sp. OV330 TaxID=1855288 RepID=UPI0008E508DF|nr:hypothetical protein [Cohnella sp. OV330]SFB44212.1 hypothetical protein SAMN05216312_108122 [Cohnella sp. OV330]
MKNKSLIGSAVFGCLCGMLFLAYDRDTSESRIVTPLERIENGTAHIQYASPLFDDMPPELAQKIKRNWSVAKDLLLQNNVIDKNTAAEWKLVSSGDTAIGITNQMPMEEAFSFNDAMMSDVRKKGLQKGDAYPAILWNEKAGKAIFFWLRSNGHTAAYFTIEAEQGEKEGKVWRVTSVLNEVQKT